MVRDWTLLLLILISCSFAVWSDFVPGVLALLGLLNLIGVLEVGTPLRPRRESLVGLVDDPCPVPQYVVDIAVRRDSVVTAVDTGVVTFADGWLVFHGLGTNFSLSMAQLTEVDSVHDTWWQVFTDLGYSRAFRIEGTPIDVSFRSRCGRAFTMALDEWERENKSVGTSVAPPLAIGPAAWRTARRLALRSFAKLALSASLLAHLPFHRSFADSFWALSVYGVVWSGLFLQAIVLAGYVGDACRKLRRFDSSTPPPFEPPLEVNDGSSIGSLSRSAAVEHPQPSTISPRT